MSEALNEIVGDLYADVKRTYAILMLLKSLSDRGELNRHSEGVSGLDEVAESLVQSFISVAAELGMPPAILKSASARLRAIEDRFDEIDEMFRVKSEGASRQN